VNESVSVGVSTRRYYRQHCCREWKKWKISVINTLKMHVMQPQSRTRV